MKKWISLALVLVLALSATLALAEVTLVSNADGYNIYALDMIPYSYGVPEDWLVVELTEDEIAWGQIAKWEAADQSASVLLTLEELQMEEFPDGITTEQLAELMKGWKGYKDISVVTIGQRPFIAYAQPKEGTLGLMTLLELLEDQGAGTNILHFDFAFQQEDDANVTFMQKVASLFEENGEDAAQDDDAP